MYHERGRRTYFFWKNTVKPAMLKQRLNRAKQILDDYVDAGLSKGYTKRELFETCVGLPGDVIWAADRFRKKSSKVDK